MASILKILFVFFCLTFVPLIAKDFGQQGHVFQIMEENLLSYIQRKVNSLSEGEISLIQDKLKNQFVQFLKEPPKVEALKEATKKRVFYFDPTVCINQDITNHEGSIIVKKGTCANPLTQMDLTQEVLFFDATQIDHLKWAKNQSKTAKWILVKGKPLELEEKEERPIFFDQFGILVKKLDIRHVPAKLTQEGLKLKIEEIPVKETACPSP